MKVLVTGFEPFNGRDINPSQLILERLEAPEGVTLIKELLPVEFKTSIEILKSLLKEHQPDVVLSLGQAGNRPEIAVNTIRISGRTLFAFFCPAKGFIINKSFFMVIASK